MAGPKKKPGKKLPKNKRLAKKLTAGIVRDENRDLTNQARHVRREARNEARNAKATYKRGKGDLKYVHGETDDFLAKLNSETAAMYSDQRGKQEAATASLRSQLGQTYDQAGSDASAELARLGISGGGNFSQLALDRGFSDAQAQQAGTNALSSMDFASANAATLGNMLRGMNQGSYMSNRGQNLNNYNDTMSKIRQTRSDGVTKVRQAKRDVAAGRGDVFMQILQSLRSR